jgi:hypothetical protein
VSAWTSIRDSAGKAIRLGRQLKVNSLPVTLASDQDPIAVTGAAAQYTAVAGSQQIVLATSVALVVPPGATVALMSVETGYMRYTDDGTVPTGTLGMPIAPGTPFWAPTKTLSGILVARDSGSAAATLNVSYYKV